MGRRLCGIRVGVPVIKQLCIIIMNEDLTRQRTTAHGVDGGALSAGVIRLSPLPPPTYGRVASSAFGTLGSRHSSSRAPAEYNRRRARKHPTHPSVVPQQVFTDIKRVNAHWRSCPRVKVHRKSRNVLSYKSPNFFRKTCRYNNITYLNIIYYTVLILCVIIEHFLVVELKSN